MLLQRLLSHNLHPDKCFGDNNSLLDRLTTFSVKCEVYKTSENGDRCGAERCRGWSNEMSSPKHSVYFGMRWTVLKTLCFNGYVFQGYECFNFHHFFHQNHMRFYSYLSFQGHEYKSLPLINSAWPWLLSSCVYPKVKSNKKNKAVASVNTVSWGLSLTQSVCLSLCHADGHLAGGHWVNFALVASSEAL